MFLITASLDLNVILKSDHRRKHLLFISTGRGVSYLARKGRAFLLLPNEETSDSPISFKYKRNRLFFAFHSAVPLKLCPTTEMMKLLQVQDKFGLRGPPAAVMEKRSWHGSHSVARSSHSVTVLWHWAKHQSLREASSAFCWFYVAIRFGSESRDHSMSSCFLQEESIWGIKYSKNLTNLSPLTLPCLMELSLQKTSSSFFVLPCFHKTSWRPNTGKLLLKASLIPILLETVILSWDIFFLNTFYP